MVKKHSGAGDGHTNTVVKLRFWSKNQAIELLAKGGGHEAKLAYLGHLLTENRHGLIVDTAVTAASGTAERDAAIVMLGELPLTTRRVTVGADKLYDTRDWVAAVRRMQVTPHVAASVNRH